MSVLDVRQIDEKSPYRVNGTSDLAPMEKDPIVNEASESAPVKYNQPIIWRNVVLLTVLHAAAAYGVITSLFQLNFKTWIWLFATGGAAGFGVTAGAHRLWTHRSYKATLPLRIILIVCYSMSGHNPVFDWVRDHRVHHRFSETDADPHNARRGFFFAHVGWLMLRKHPEVKAKGSLVDMSDITSDPIVMFHRKNFVLMQLTFCFVIPILVPYLMWGESGFIAIMSAITRYVIVLNITWLVNSAAHIWGNKPFNRKISPAENQYVSFLSMGEGWHNYHHVFPWDYKAAELGNYSLNLTTFWIDFFALLGWAYDRRAPVSTTVRKYARAYGDGSHRRWGHSDHPEETCVEEETHSLDSGNLKSQ